MVRFTILSTFIVSAAFVAAQTPSECITTCASTAATDNGCASFTDFECVCLSEPFQQQTAACIQTNCPDELEAALQLQQLGCAPFQSGSSSGLEATIQTSTDLPSTTRTTTSNSNTSRTTVPNESSSSSSSSSSSAESSSTSGSVAFHNAAAPGMFATLAVIIGAAVL